MDHTEQPALMVVTAKALQGFVLGSDKLREMVGATQLIEDFCSAAFADEILKSHGLRAYEVITCAAGQTTVRFDRVDEALKAAAFWPWAAHRLAPGLEVHVAVAPLAAEPGGYARAFAEVQKELAESRNAFQLPDSPPAQPPVFRAPRSGGSAVEYERFGGESEAVDACGGAKRARRQAIRREARRQSDLNPVFEAFGFDPDDNATDFNGLAKMPVLLRDFMDEDGQHRKFEARQSCLAMIHADGNGLGQAFIDLADGLATLPNDGAMECMAAFSADFRQVGIEASRRAIETLERMFLRPLPVFPVVLAGDDLTLVTRGELAVPLAEAWLMAFEQASCDVITSLKERFPVVAEVLRIESLSAGAGILFFQRSHPFMSAYDQCETLASLAKSEAKLRADGGVAPCSVAFQRLTGGFDLGASGNEGRHRLSGMPYFLGERAQGLRTMDQLRELRDALRSLPSGSLRHLLTELRLRPDAAQAWLNRALRVLRGRQGGAEKVERIERALATLHQGDPGSLWHQPADDDAPRWTAVPDALCWMSAEPAFPENKPSEQQ